MAIKALTPAERMLFYRKYYYRQSTEQIAAELGLTRRAVEGRLYRIRQLLRDKLGGVYHG
jgi:RNA polymerase sigma-70 factor (ECF subfamily)